MADAQAIGLNAEALWRLEDDMVVNRSKVEGLGRRLSGRSGLLASTMLTGFGVWLVCMSGWAFAQGLVEADLQSHRPASRVTYYTVPCSAACFTAFAESLAAEVSVIRRVDDAVVFTLESYPGVEVRYSRQEIAGGTRLRVATAIDATAAQSWLQAVAAAEVVDVVHRLESITYVPPFRRHAAAFTAAERAEFDARLQLLDADDADSALGGALDGEAVGWANAVSDAEGNTSDPAAGEIAGASSLTDGPVDTAAQASDIVAAATDPEVTRAAEARRARWSLFERRHGIVAFPPTEEIVANPFRFDGQTVGLIGRFETMLAADVAWLTLGEGQAAVLIAVPRDAFSSAGPVVVAAEVRGMRLDGLPGGNPAPELTYLGSLRCLLDDCSDVFGEGGASTLAAGSPEANAVAASFAGATNAESASGPSPSFGPTRGVPGSGDGASSERVGDEHLPDDDVSGAYSDEPAVGIDAPAPGDASNAEPALRSSQPLGGPVGASTAMPRDIKSPLLEVTVPEQEPAESADDRARPADPIDGVTSPTAGTAAPAEGNCTNDRAHLAPLLADHAEPMLARLRREILSNSACTVFEAAFATGMSVADVTAEAELAVVTTRRDLDQLRVGLLGATPRGDVDAMERCSRSVQGCTNLGAVYVSIQITLAYIVTRWALHLNEDTLRQIRTYPR